MKVTWSPERPTTPGWYWLAGVNPIGFAMVRLDKVLAPTSGGLVYPVSDDAKVYWSPADVPDVPPEVEEMLRDYLATRG